MVTYNCSTILGGWWSNTRHVTDHVRGLRLTWLRACSPDLYKSVILEPTVPASRYRFVSNGRVAAKPLRELSKEVKKIEGSFDPLTALDAVDARHLYKRCRLTGRDFFLKILQTIGDDADPKKLWHLLRRLEINDGAREDQFLDSIDRALKLLVDKREDLESKRDELLGQILQRAKAGESVSAAEILRKAGLEPERLSKAESASWAAACANI